jgi:hypothetical protein
MLIYLMVNLYEVNWIFNRLLRPEKHKTSKIKPIELLRETFPVISDSSEPGLVLCGSI